MDHDGASKPPIYNMSRSCHVAAKAGCLTSDILSELNRSSGLLILSTCDMKMVHPTEIRNLRPHTETGKVFAGRHDVDTQ
jgi:hypothetical protein